MIDMLSRRHDVAVLYLLPTDFTGFQRSPSACNHMTGIPIPAASHDPKPFWARLMEAGRELLGDKPDWVRSAWSPTMAAASVELASDFRPHVVQFEFHVMSQYLPFVRKAAPDAACVVTEHEPGVVAADEHGSAKGSIRHRLGSLVRRRAWARFETRALSRADAVVTFTEKDQAVIRALLGGCGTEVVCIPLRFPIERRPASEQQAPIPTDLLFIGAFQHPPNVDAAMRLATDIFPTIRRTVPRTRLYIVGGDPPPELLAAAGNGLSVTGWVEDPQPYLAGASVVLCPLRQGGGIRVKVLEACVSGKALIASASAVEGLSIRPGIEFVLASSDEEFVDSAIDLLSNAAKREQLGQAAQRWARRTQDTDEWSAEYDALYDRLMTRRSHQKSS